ncbi:hypothetical protein LINPERHAP1_LOCUS29139, partial [Linum perenne]
LNPYRLCSTKKIRRCNDPHRICTLRPPEISRQLRRHSLIWRFHQQFIGRLKTPTSPPPSSPLPQSSSGVSTSDSSAT